MKSTAINTNTVGFKSKLNDYSQLIKFRLTFTVVFSSILGYLLGVEGEINWSNNAEKINGKINGLYPVPGAFFIYKGERYKILKAEIGNGIGSPGEIISDYLEVACGYKQSIKIKEIQRQGKKPQNIGEFMLGSQIKKGTNI